MVCNLKSLTLPELYKEPTGISGYCLITVCNIGMSKLEMRVSFDSGSYRFAIAITFSRISSIKGDSFSSMFMIKLYDTQTLHTSSNKGMYCVEDNISENFEGCIWKREKIKLNLFKNYFIAQTSAPFGYESF